jgi:3-hydroxyisobutyrate dehydrogenase
MTNEAPKYGFIGLGNIGGPMACRMAQQSNGAVVYDVNAVSAQRLAPFAAIARSPAAVGKCCNVVGVCVRDDDDVRTVLCGPDGLLEGMAPGGAVMIHSTVALETIERLAAVGEDSGVHVVDAGVTGGPSRAAEGTLVTMVGASPAVFEQVRGLAETFSSDVLLCGPVGSGIVVKICNNIVSYTSVLAAHEAFGLVEACGIDNSVLERVLSGNKNLNEIMEVVLSQRRGGAALASSNHARLLASKDLSHAAELAQKTGWGDAGIQAIHELLPRIFAEEA